MLNFHCSICQQGFNENNTISALLCGHVYHFECIKMWLDKKSNCPQCRSPSVGNFIRKLFFEKLSDVNNSLNLSDYKTEEYAKLIIEIEKLQDSNKILQEEKSNILSELKGKSLENCELLMKLSRVEDNLKSKYLSYTHVISEREEEIRACRAKLDKFMFIHDILNKEQPEIDLYIANLPNSDDLKLQNELLCSAIVSSKTDLDYYKKNSDNMSKKLVKSELKVVTLLSEISSLKKEISHLKNIDSSFQDNCSKAFEASVTVIPETPDNSSNKANLRRELSTPEILMMSTPENNYSNDRKIFRQRMLENPFRCTPSQKKKKNTKSLLEMAIMKNHSSRQTVPNHSNIVWYRDEDDDDTSNHNPSEEPEKKKKKVSRSKHIQPIKRN